MLNVLLEGLGEDHYIVDITACIYFIAMELLVHIVLHVRGRDGITLWEDIVYVQFFLHLCYSLPAIFDCNGHLAKCFNDVESGDERATIDGADYLVLMEERLGIKNDHFIKTSEVNY